MEAKTTMRVSFLLSCESRRSNSGIVMLSNKCLDPISHHCPNSLDGFKSIPLF